MAYRRPLLILRLKVKLIISFLIKYNNYILSECNTQLDIFKSIGAFAMKFQLSSQIIMSLYIKRPLLILRLKGLRSMI